MKWPVALLCLVLFASDIAFAGDRAQLAIDGSVESAKNATVQVLKEAGYSLRTQTSAGMAFSKELTGGQKFFVLNFLSAESCQCIAPSLYLTVHFSDTGHGTLETISASIERTTRDVRGPEPSNLWMNTPYLNYTSCEIVRDPPIFMHAKPLIDGILNNIASKAVKSAAP